MGADWSAFALIGLRVSKDKTIKISLKERNNCICVQQFKSNDPEIKYCPKCGKEISYLTEVESGTFEDRNGDSILGEYKGVWATDRDSLFFPIKVVEADHFKLLKDYEISNEEFEKFKNTMREAGIWNEEEFGLWSILYCSY